jgi:hypothetical protein
VHGCLHSVNVLPTDWSLVIQLDYLVQMKQAQSSLGEAETAGRLNNFIMLFTLITVVFVS